MHLNVSTAPSKFIHMYVFFFNSWTDKQEVTQDSRRRDTAHGQPITSPSYQLPTNSCSLELRQTQAPPLQEGYDMVDKIYNMKIIKKKKNICQLKNTK